MAGAGERAAKLVMDPIHGFIDIRGHPVVGELVETALFQRLRRVGQLGLAHLVYPSATHTRFAHSLGAMRTFLTLYDSIMGGGGGAYMRDEIDDMRELGAAAALLHDIGHGPFSHAFESIMGQAGFDHEEMARRIVAETEIGDLLDAHGVGSRDVCAVLGGGAGNGGGEAHGLVRRLISSQLDADRLDYLMRDSYFTGVNYGKIDLLRIANTLEIDEAGGGIVVAGRGIGAVEGYIVGRYLMYKNVYYHHTVRQMECVLERAFARAAELGAAETGLDALCDPAGGGPPGPDEMLAADDGTATALVGRWARSGDAVLADLASRITGRRRLAHRYVARAGLDDAEADAARMARLRASFDAAGLPAEYYLIIDDESKAAYTRYEPSGAGGSGGGSGSGDILVRPEAGYGDGGGGGGGLAEISSLSAVVGALVHDGAGAGGGGGQHVRLFYPHKMEGAVDAAFGPRRAERGAQGRPSGSDA